LLLRLLGLLLLVPLGLLLILLHLEDDGRSLQERREGRSARGHLMGYEPQGA
jgi:hypothetical protein